MTVRVHPFRPGTVVEAGSDGTDLDAALEAEVQALWEAEQARRGGNLFNNRLFSVQTLDEDRIVGRFVEYRLFVAQRAKPALFERLGVRPLAVSGLLRCAQGVVFGLRHGATTQESGLWELVPSGGVGPAADAGEGRVDVRRQLLDELGEEIGLDAGSVTDVRPFCLVEDTESNVLDIGIELVTVLEAEAIREAHRQRASDDYSDLEVVPVPEIPGIVARWGPRVAEVSRVLLRERGLWAG